jgi:uncharacterized protein YbaP (TraB family)
VRYLLALAALCFAASAHAGPAAWRVTSEMGGELWLLGSVHLLRAADHPLPEVVDELYAQAGTLVMEIDLDDIDAAQSQQEFLAAAMLARGTTLPDVLAPETYALAQTRARAMGIDLALLKGFEPWLVAITMLELGLARLDFRPEYGIERYLLNKAELDGKEVLGLETIATQIAIFDDLPADQQEALLEQTLAEIDSAEEVMNQMVDAWRSGELEALAATLMADFADFPELYSTLVIDRNMRWIETLEALLKKPERHLVVVGALHLVGEHNVVDLLAGAGFVVEAIE